MENFQGGYNESRPKRTTLIIERYGKDWFRGKTFLEVGAGYGFLGATFATTYGADVVCTDGRPEYVAKIKHLHPYVRAEYQDLEEPWPYKNKFDFILHMGVLHHVHPDHVEQAIIDFCNASDNIVLDLEVYDDEDDHFILPMKEVQYDQSIYGMGNRTSTNCIERILTEQGMSFERVKHNRLNGPAIHDWLPGYAPAIGPRRFWFIWK